MLTTGSVPVLQRDMTRDATTSRAATPQMSKHETLPVLP
jgi:hypothetical protein